MISSDVTATHTSEVRAPADIADIKELKEVQSRPRFREVSL